MARFERSDEVFEITSNDARYAHEVKKHLREGWIRVADPRCEVPLGAEPRNPTFEAALHDDPDDIGTKLVYADWLQQQGHPRGALAAVQHRLSSSPKDVELLAEERRLIQYGGDSLISKPLAAQLSICRGGYEIVSGGSHIYTAGTLRLDHGFLRSAQLHLQRFAGDEDLVWELLRHPSSRALAELEIVLDRSRDMDLVVSLLMHGPELPLRRLLLSTNAPTATLGLRRVGIVFPRLESLVIAVNNVRFGDAALPHLRQLVIGSSDDFHLAVENMPAIETLTISKHDVNKLIPAFDHHLPRLKHVMFPAANSLALLRMIARSPVGPRLETLQMHGVEGGLDFLLENRARFAKLKKLTIDLLRQPDAERLREAGYPL